MRALGLLGDRLLDFSPGSPRRRALTPTDTLNVESFAELGDLFSAADTALRAVTAASGDLRLVTAKVRQGNGTVARLCNDAALYDTQLRTVRRADAVLTQVQGGKGTLGRPLRDTESVWQRHQRRDCTRQRRVTAQRSRWCDRTIAARYCLLHAPPSSNDRCRFAGAGAECRPGNGGAVAREARTVRSPAACDGGSRQSGRRCATQSGALHEGRCAPLLTHGRWAIVGGALILAGAIGAFKTGE